MFLQKLIKMAQKSEKHLIIKFDPDCNSEWYIRFYPDTTSDAHFWFVHQDIEECAKGLLDEMDDA